MVARVTNFQKQQLSKAVIPATWGGGGSRITSCPGKVARPYLENKNKRDGRIAQSDRVLAQQV
jgi:hypothetical protein